MRIVLKFKSLYNFKYDEITNYEIQGFIYSLLDETPFKDYHNVKGFKFFNYSNIFPISDFKQDEEKKIIISSPSNAFIKLLYHELKKLEIFRLKKYYMEIQSVKIINNTFCTNKLITGTPIVLYEDNLNGRYYSFKSNPDFDFFFKRLTDNAIKKYEAYYGDEYLLNKESLFDSFEFNKEVSIRTSIRKKKFIMIGSLWNFDININNSNRKFYNFLFDCGLGEKNSLGMGFINNRR